MDKEYLIRKDSYWYRTDAQGYTSNVHKAGLFTLEQAKAYTYPNGPDGPRDGHEYYHTSEIFTSSPPSEVYLRDVDGSGSMHVCAKGDVGAIRYILDHY